MNGELTLQFVGLAWWLVLPLALGAAWSIGRLARRELATQPPRVARGLAWLRRAVVVLVLLFLLEPTLTRIRTESELPIVAVVVDRSGSMALDDHQMAAGARLDEAVALGLIDPGLRPTAPRRVARALADLLADGPGLAQAVAAVGEAQADGAVPPAVDDARLRAEYHAGELAVLAPAAAGLPAMGEGLTALRAAMMRAGAALTPRVASADGVASEADPAALAAQLGKAMDTARELMAGAEVAQRAADTALVAGAEAGSPIAGGLATLGNRSREQRAFDLVRRRVLPRLADRAQVVLYALDERGAATGGLSVVAAGQLTAAAPDGTTDFAAPLAWLSRSWSSRHVGGVLLLSDGRQTAGADPVPVARALAARGGRVSALLVGDPQPPRDAVVAEVSAPAEVFRGEVAHLDARWRVTGFSERAWDLVLTGDGRELERRTVRGATSWQVARFEVPAEALVSPEQSQRAFQVRIEPSREKAGETTLRGGAGLLREVWTGVAGNRLDGFFANPGLRAPDSAVIVADAIFADNRENHASRLRGWAVPPASGSYTFWVEGDDETELWIAPSGRPEDTVRIAAVPEWTQTKEWDKFAAQRSLPLALRAGRPCYIEVRHKQGTGGAHAAVGWQTPDNTIERPIAGARLAPWSVGSAAVAARDDEEASLANNAAEATVAVAQDPLHVLVLDEQPRWELRYLVALFERDRRVEVVRRYRSVRLPRQEFELLPPDLDAFDVVVLGDLPPAVLGSEDQQRLTRFVGRRGGFLIAVAGPRGMPWGYHLGGLADLLPVRAAGGPTAERKPVAVALTVAGQSHPITAVLDDVLLNQKLWPELPRLEWAATAVAAKPGAEVLLATIDPVAPAPIVALARYGSGRVLWAGSDDLWRWRDRLGDRVHQTFWLQAVRWGLGARLRGSDRRLQVALDRGQIEPGEAAELRARALDGEGRPVGVPRVTLERLDDAGEPIAQTRQEPALSAVADADLASVRIAGIGLGRWRLTVTSDDSRLAGLSEVRELVVRRRPGDEGIELGSDAAGLARLAAAGGGTSGGFAEVDTVLDAFVAGLEPRVSERRATLSLWQNHGALAVVLVMLVAEWLWRKRRGLP